MLGGWRLGRVWHCCWEGLQTCKQRCDRRRERRACNGDRGSPRDDRGKMEPVALDVLSEAV